MVVGGKKRERQSEPWSVSPLVNFFGWSQGQRTSGPAEWLVAGTEATRLSRALQNAYTAACASAVTQTESTEERKKLKTLSGIAPLWPTERECGSGSEMVREDRERGRNNERKRVKDENGRKICVKYRKQSDERSEAGDRAMSLFKHCDGDHLTLMKIFTYYAKVHEGSRGRILGSHILYFCLYLYISLSIIQLHIFRYGIFCAHFL